MKRCRNCTAHTLCTSPVIESGDTRTRFWKILAWSLQALYDGLWPRQDWRGVPYPRGGSSEEGNLAGRQLAGGYFGCLWGIKADLEFYGNTMGLEGLGDANPCLCCRADNRDDSRPWTDHREGAAWEATIWTDATWRPAHPIHCPLFDLPGFTVLMIFIDLMHTRYIGTDQWFCGSVLYLLCYMIMPGTPEENCTAVFARMKRHWKDL